MTSHNKTLFLNINNGYQLEIIDKIRRDNLKYKNYKY